MLSTPGTFFVLSNSDRFFVLSDSLQVPQFPSELLLAATTSELYVCMWRHSTNSTTFLLGNLANLGTAPGVALVVEYLWTLARPVQVT